MLSIAEKIELIANSTSLDDVRNIGILPEPNSESDYWFVSYSHKDYKSVLVNILELQNRGIRLWYDRGLDTGRDWRENVRLKIFSFHCRGVIAFVSDNFMASSACSEEIKYIKNSNKPCLILHINCNAKPFVKRCAYKSIDCDYDEKIELLYKMPRPQLYKYIFYGPVDKSKPRKYAILAGVNDNTIQKADIPAFIKKNGQQIPVIAIGKRAFFNCTELTEVAIPDGWSDIENEAFANCFSLKKVTLGKPIDINSSNGKKVLAQQYVSLTNLSNADETYVKKHSLSIVFNLWLYKKLNKREWGRGVKYVGNIRGAFKNCIELKQIEFTFPFDKKVAICARDAFVNCVSLNDVDFDVSRYYGSSFMGCSALTQVKFNARQKCYEEMCAYLPSLKRAEFSHANKTKHIPQNAFNGCVALEEIVLPRHLLEIDDSAFESCKSLKTIALPLSLKSIGENSFADSALESLVLPKKLRFVAKNAFKDAKNLKTVTLNCSKLSFSEKERRNKPFVDEWFSNVETLYLKRGVKNKLSENRIQVPSDKKGYKKYVRRDTNGINA